MQKNFAKHLVVSQKLTTFALAFENKPLGQQVLSGAEARKRHLSHERSDKSSLTRFT